MHVDAILQKMAVSDGLDHASDKVTDPWMTKWRERQHCPPTLFSAAALYSTEPPVIRVFCHTTSRDGSRMKKCI